MDARIVCKDEYCVEVSEWEEELLLINKIALYFYVKNCFLFIFGSDLMGYQDLTRDGK